MYILKMSSSWGIYQIKVFFFLVSCCNCFFCLFMWYNLWIGRHNHSPTGVEWGSVSHETRSLCFHFTTNPETPVLKAVQTCLLITNHKQTIFHWDFSSGCCADDAVGLSLLTSWWELFSFVQPDAMPHLVMVVKWSVKQALRVRGSVCWLLAQRSDLIITCVSYFTSWCFWLV